MFERLLRLNLDELNVKTTSTAHCPARTNKPALSHRTHLDPSWRSNKDVDTFFGLQTQDIVPQWVAAGQRNDLNTDWFALAWSGPLAHVLAELFQHSRSLQRQFTSGHKYKPLDMFLRSVNLLQHRDAESSRFARTVLGTCKNIAACNRHRRSSQDWAIVKCTRDLIHSYS